jgi:hypothetical protein
MVAGLMDKSLDAELYIVFRRSEVALSTLRQVNAKIHHYCLPDALMQFFQELKLCIERSYPDAGWHRIWRHSDT